MGLVYGGGWEYRKFLYGKDIDSLIERCLSFKEATTLYFHNLKFDGEFIIHWLFTHGFTHIKDRKEAAPKTFTTLISDRGVFYSIVIYFTAGKHAKKIEILDSLKVLPYSVEAVAKAFALSIRKLEIDYEKPRPVGYELEDQEIAYIKNDVVIIAEALKALHEQGLTKMTTASNALNEYKSLVKRKFNYWFPKPDYDAFIRASYRGGWTYANPDLIGQDIGVGAVYDVNSLYPSVMYYSPMPYGDGVAYDGEYETDTEYNLYVQRLSCQFELKEGYLPTLQEKNNLAFVPTEYLTSSKGEELTLTLTSVDLALLFEHYDVFDITWLGGYKFKSAVGLFKDYIDKWNGIKIQATRDKNEGLRTIAKLMLNSLYGKFAMNPKVQSKFPYLGEDNMVHYELGPEETRDGLYIPMGTFITAWARDKTIRSAQKVKERFLYADTDSLHLIGDKIPDGLEVSPTELGKWKQESVFTRARFIRAKSYIEEIDGKLEIKCAGMPASLHKYVTWDNFRVGSVFDGGYEDITDEGGVYYGKRYRGKLRHTHVPGGIVLLPTPFTIRD